MIHAPAEETSNTTQASRANHERIKYELRRRGYSLAKVSQRLNISKSAVSLVSIGTQRSQRIETEIAALIEEPLEVAFPDRYNASQQAN